MAVQTRPGELDDALPGRIRAILDSLLDPHILLTAVRDESGGIIDFVFADANPAACEFNQLPCGELVGRRLLDLHPAAESSGLLAMYVNVVESGDPLILDDWSYPQDLLEGETRRYDVRCVKVGDGLTQTWRDVTDHYRMHQSLALREAEYRLLAENATDLVYRTDTNQRVTWVSPSVESALGWATEDFVGHRMADFLHPEDAELVAEQRDAVYRGDALLPSRTRLPPFRMRTSDGGYRWMTGTGTSVLTDSGAVAGLIFGLHDVDDLVQARLEAEVARTRENRTRLSMAAAAIGMALIGPDQRLTYANPAMSTMLDYPLGALEGLTFRDITHPDDLAKGVAAVKDVLAGLRDSFTQRKRYLRRGGEVIWVDLSVAAVRQDDGSLDHFVAQLVDVTDEVLSSAALRSTTEKFRLLAENASDVVFETDLDDVVTWIAPSVTRVLGWPAESIVGTHSLDFVHPDFVEVGREVRQQAHDGGYPAALSTRYRTAAGSFLDVSTLIRPVIDDTGLVTGTVFGLRDITDERRAQMALEYGERQFRLVVQAAPQGMAVSTSDGVIVMTNPAFCDLLGRAESEVLGTLADGLSDAGGGRQRPPPLRRARRGLADAASAASACVRRQGGLGRSRRESLRRPRWVRDAARPPIRRPDSHSPPAARTRSPCQSR